MDTPTGPGDDPQSKIRHTDTRLGDPLTPPKPAPDPLAPPQEPLPVEQGFGPSTGSNKIKALGTDKRHEDAWTRTPNTTGHGAIHVRSFHCKLTDDALVYMDQCVNEWLDAHPQYEVKFVTSTVGTLTGKTKEPHLICQIWV